MKSKIHNSKKKKNGHSVQINALLGRMAQMSMGSRKSQQSARVRAPVGTIVAQRGTSRGGRAAGSDHISTFKRAVVNPFDVASRGCRVPTGFPLSTTTWVGKLDLTISTTAGGILDGICVPHPVYSFLNASNGGITGATSIAPSYTNGLSYYSAVGAADLQSKLTNYRIVSWGVRLKTNANYSNSQGRISVVSLPAMPQFPVRDEYNSGGTGTRTSFFQALGVPYDGSAGVSPNLTGFAKSRKFAYSEIMSHDGIQILPQFTAPSHETFNECGDLNEQGLTNVTGTTLVASASNTSIGSACTAGHSILAFYGSGLAPSSPVLTVEVIYHLEGAPNGMTSGATGDQILQPSGLAPPPPSSPAVIAAAKAANIRAPWVQGVAEISKALGNLAIDEFAPVPMRGTAEKLLGMGVDTLAQYAGGYFG